MKHLTFVFCTLAAICTTASAEVFRRDADYVTWFLKIEGTEFEITTFKSETEHSRTRGRIIEESPQMVLCEDSRLSEQPSVVHGKRLFRKQHQGIFYLVEESRLSAFEDAKGIQEEILRVIELSIFPSRSAARQGEE